MRRRAVEISPDSLLTAAGDRKSLVVSGASR
jgi:hypothetical protein